MRPTVNRFVIWGVALGALAVVPAAIASGEPEDPLVESRWVPSLAVTGGLTFQRQEANVRSFETASPSTPLRGSRSGDELSLAPSVGASLEVMSPTLPFPGRPRLFVTGGFDRFFGVERNIVQEGAADESGLTLPRGTPSQVPGFTHLRNAGVSEGEVRGVGSRVSSQFDNLAFEAGLGLAFPVELFGRRLLVKPSFGWLRYQVEVDGLVQDATCQVWPNGFSDTYVFDPSAFPTADDGDSLVFNGLEQCVDSLANTNSNSVGGQASDGAVQLIRLAASDSLTLDAIGPGLEIELDTGRFGPLGTSVFLGAHAYRILGDRSVDISVTRFVPGVETIDPNTYTADFSFEVNPWVYRAGVGLRLHWLGPRR